LTKRAKILLFLLGIFLCYVGYSKKTIFQKEKIPEAYYIENDLPQILQKGKLTILAENSSTSFFIYRGKKMGFEYEILKEFANELGVDLEIKIIKNLDELDQKLADGEGDLIACNYTITKERCKRISFSLPYIRSNQVLIQRKPDGWEKMKEKEVKSKLINDPVQLINKKVNVWRNSSYYQRLTHLEEEIGDKIDIVNEDGQTAVEELIEMVSDGIIDYTVTEHNIAKVNAAFYNNIDYHLSLSVKQKIAFGLRKSSPLLKIKLDNWLEAFMRKPVFKYIKHKYFDVSHYLINSKIEKSNLKNGQLSPYDNLFKEACLKHNWEWTLLAAQCYQESKFNPNAISFGGAYSMMQFMPETGPYYGVYPDSPVEIQIIGGLKKMKKDFSKWKEIPDSTQRMKFALASYNAGGGHIQDAVRLAIKHGKNPLIWDDNVEEMVLLLSKKEYYRDPLVKCGAMRGKITVHYVKEIMARHTLWKTLYE
jgi:membrane-bound lytic murein transglycosylase F